MKARLAPELLRRLGRGKVAVYDIDGRSGQIIWRLGGRRSSFAMGPGTGIAYQHETSRCGDPHLHTHVLVSNRQARADGRLVSIDSKSLYHEAKAAGIIYQATLRRELHRSLGFEWAPVDPATGMAEMAGVDRDSIIAWSRRSSQLRQWAARLVVDQHVTGRRGDDLQLERARFEPQALLLALAEEQRLAVLDEDLGFGRDLLAGDMLEHRVVEDDAILQDFDE